jgi:hypothetical protein
MISIKKNLPVFLLFCFKLGFGSPDADIYIYIYIYILFFEVSVSLMLIYVYSFRILKRLLVSSLHVKHNFGLCIDYLLKYIWKERVFSSVKNRSVLRRSFSVKHLLVTVKLFYQFNQRNISELTIASIIKYISL